MLRILRKIPLRPSCFRRPKSIHQYSAKGSPTTTLKPSWCICIFLLFLLKKQAFWYTPNLFFASWGTWVFRAENTFGVLFPLRCLEIEGRTSAKKLPKVRHIFRLPLAMPPWQTPPQCFWFIFLRAIRLQQGFLLCLECLYALLSKHRETKTALLRPHSEAWGPPQFQEKHSRNEKAILGALGEFRGILGAAPGIQWFSESEIPLSEWHFHSRNDISRLEQYETRNSRSNSRSDSRIWREPHGRFSFAPTFSERFFKNWDMGQDFYQNYARTRVEGRFFFSLFWPQTHANKQRTPTNGTFFFYLPHQDP